MTTAFDRGVVPEITLRHRLRIAREHAGLEQAELAILMGVSRSTVSNAELGKAKGDPQPSTINLWAFACGVPAVWLRTGQSPDGGPDPNNRSLDYKDAPRRVSQLRTVLSAGHSGRQVPQHRAS